MASDLVETCNEALLSGLHFPNLWQTVIRAHPDVGGSPVTDGPNRVAAHESSDGVEIEDGGPSSELSEKRIIAQHRSDEASKRLRSILGIGIVVGQGLSAGVAMGICG